MRIQDATRQGPRILAQPLAWSAHEAAEQPYSTAEDVRLLYVAATRAKEELVVARCDATEDGSCWSDLHASLDAPGQAERIDLPSVPSEPRPRLPDAPDEIRRRMETTQARRERSAEPTYRARPVTARVHGDEAGAIVRDGLPVDAAGHLLVRTELIHLRPGEEGDDHQAPARGREWGSAVHRALEAAGRGATGESLRRLCRLALKEFERPVDDAGDPVELDELISLVERVLESDVWARVRSGRSVLVEVPFAFAVDAETAAELGVESPAATELLEGVIDLAFQDEAGAWTIIDFKTDARLDPEREALYRRQLRVYAEGFTRSAGAGEPG